MELQQRLSRTVSERRERTLSFWSTFQSQVYTPLERQALLLAFKVIYCFDWEFDLLFDELDRRQMRRKVPHLKVPVRPHGVDQVGAAPRRSATQLLSRKNSSAQR